MSHEREFLMSMLGDGNPATGDGDASEESGSDDEVILNVLPRHDLKHENENLHVRLFGLDLRGIAALRICCGAIMLVDLWLRSYDLGTFYTGRGIMPMSLYTYQKAPYYWSLYFLSDGRAFVTLLMWVHAAFAAMLLVGYQSKIASIGCWVMLLSIQNRNSTVLDGGDFLLMNLLFWGTFFLPWSQRWSVDAMRSGTGIQQSETAAYWFGASSIAYIIFIMIIYMYNAITKRDAVWLGNDQTPAMATWMALNYEQVTSRFGDFVREYCPHILLEWATQLVWYLEMWGTLLLFVPYRNAYFRVAMVTLFVTFHLGVAMMMVVGIFPYADFASLIPLLPVEAFDWFENRVLATIAARISRSRTACRVLPAQAIHRLSTYMARRTWVSSIDEVVYEPLHKTLPACFFMWFVYNWNLFNVNDPPMPLGTYVGAFWVVAPLLRIDQSWTMFAPHPFVDDGWLVYSGRLVGQTVEHQVDFSQYLNNGRVNFTGVSWDKPRHVHETFRGYRWTKYLINEYASYARQAYTSQMNKDRWAQYICEKYNRKAPAGKQLAQLSINYMLEQTPKGEYGPPAPPKRLVFTNWNCLVKGIPVDPLPAPEETQDIETTAALDQSTVTAVETLATDDAAASSTVTTTTLDQSTAPAAETVTTGHAEGTGTAKENALNTDMSATTTEPPLTNERPPVEQHDATSQASALENTIAVPQHDTIAAPLAADDVMVMHDEAPASEPAIAPVDEGTDSEDTSGDIDFGSIDFTASDEQAADESEDNR